MKTQFAVAALVLMSGVAHAGDEEKDEIDDVVDDLVEDSRVGTVAFDVREEDDKDDPRADSEGRLPDDPPRDPPEAYEALKTLAKTLEIFAATSEVDHGEEILDVLDAISLVESGMEAFPETLCVGGKGRLLQMLDDQLALERTPADSDAARAKTALDDVCVQVPSYWLKDGSLPFDPFIHEVVDGLGPKGVPLCGVDLRVIVPGMPGESEQFEIEGYMLNGHTAVLEEGQRIGAAGCKGHVIHDDLPGSSWVEYGVTYTLKYRNKTVDGYVSTQSAHGAPLPSNILLTADQIGSTIGSLTWQGVRRECLADSCSDTNLGNERTVPLKVVSRGYMCQATYKYNQFSINDRNDVNMKNHYDSNRVIEMTGNGVTDGGVFRAFARTSPNGASTYPAWMPIGGSERFVIHADDAPISIYDHTHSRAQIIDEMGTAELSGLRFPRVESTGSETGSPKKRSYSCKPPSIQRDFVAFCTENNDLEQIDSKYLLPFKGTARIYAGNDAGWVFGAPHTKPSELYAWDFITDDMDDENIYAARAGVVIQVDESHDGHEGTGGLCETDGDPTDHECHNNRTVVLHQDGTQNVYLHSKHHGTFVDVGDIVKRGQVLAVSGCVGNCGEQHIHYDVHESQLSERQLHNLRVPRVEESMPGGAEPLSIPSTFDREEDVCDIPNTGTFPHSTLSADTGTKAYHVHVDNEYNLPFKRKITQTVPKKMAIYTFGTVITNTGTGSHQMFLRMVDQIPGSFSVTVENDGMSTTLTSSDHNILLTPSFPAPFGESHHDLKVTVVDANGHKWIKTVDVEVFHNPL